MEKIIKFLITVFISLIFSGQVMALTMNQQIIINQVLNVDSGKITKEMHEKFWRDIPDRENTAKFFETSGIMIKVVNDSTFYQRELWKSALISFQTQQVYKSKEYIKARGAINDFLNRVSKNIPNPTERKAVTERMKISMYNSDALLEGAAKRTSFKAAQGVEMPLSEERIKFIIKNIDRSFIRIQKLINPRWSGS